MNKPFNARAPAVDAEAINDTIRRALASAGLDTTASPMLGVTETIRRALAAGVLGGAAPRRDSGSVIDVDARVVPADEAAHPAANSPPPTPDSPQRPGSFAAHQFSNGAGTRAYKVYLPARESDAPPAVVVMLHGCTQSADDFAAGTQMNRLADEHGFLVVYPEQTAHANASKCWNWFKPQDQRRDAGEPSLIADIVRDVARQHGADPRRIFVAGLSAGAAMAVVLGQAYPDLFAGVGVHSGLPFGSAHDIPSALAAMKGGRSGLLGLRDAPGAGGHTRTSAPGRPQAIIPEPFRGKGTPVTAAQAVPTIVFHGDRDRTVQPSNGAQVAQQAHDAHGARPGGAALRARTESGLAPGGRRFSRTVHADTEGQARVEIWTLHGAGHAWSGGHANGSYTDPTGPDASGEMVRFFMALPHAGSA